MVRVFRSTVDNVFDAMAIVNALRKKMAFAEINIDLEDVDNILRIKDNTIDTSEIEKTVHEFGHKVILLE